MVGGKAFQTDRVKITTSPKPLIVFLAKGSPPESLLALHAMLSFHERSAFVFCQGDFSTLLSRYLANPFLNEPWTVNPRVYREPGEVRRLMERGELAGILVQASNSPGSEWKDDLHAVLGSAQDIPLAYLDMADEAGKYDRLPPVGYRYLKGSIFREFPPGPAVEPAPYLHWGLSSSRPTPVADDHPRPIDVCFLGSETTHGSRKAILRLLENWSRKHADRVKVGLYLSELTDRDRPSQERYFEILRQSKICIDLWGHAAQTRRLYEGIMGGCLVVSQAPRWLPNAWTPKEREHFIPFHSESDLITRLEYFLGSEEERKRISSRGLSWITKTFAAASIGEWLYDQTTSKSEAGSSLSSTQGGNP